MPFYSDSRQRPGDRILDSAEFAGGLEVEMPINQLPFTANHLRSSMRGFRDEADRPFCSKSAVF